MRIHARHGFLPGLSRLPRPVRFSTSTSTSLPSLTHRRQNTNTHDSTNQTTLEHISPFYLLNHLPPLPPSRLSSPPQERQLAYPQRRAVRAAHSRLRLYDVGWRRNTAQVFGSGTGLGPKRCWFAAWAARLLWGGNSCGSGTQFPRNSHAEDVLVELAAELVRLENNTDRS
jgi:hypothetical protein